MRRRVKAWAGLQWDTLIVEDVRFGDDAKAELECGDFERIVPCEILYDDGRKAKKRRGGA